MKKLLLFIGIIFVSCSPDSEPAQKTTVANKVTEMRVLIINYETMKTISDTGFKKHSSIFYSNNSNDCGLKLNGNETSQIGTLEGVKVQISTSYRYVVECN